MRDKYNTILKQIHDGPGKLYGWLIFAAHWAFFPLALAVLYIYANSGTGQWRYHDIPGENFAQLLMTLSVIGIALTKLSMRRHGQPKSRLINWAVTPFSFVTLVGAAVVAIPSALLLLIAMTFTIGNNGITGVPAILWALCATFAFLYWVAGSADADDVAEDTTET
jgi:hypothetical protein